MSYRTHNYGNERDALEKSEELRARGIRTSVLPTHVLLYHEGSEATEWSVCELGPIDETERDDYIHDAESHGFDHEEGRARGVID